MHSNSNSKIQPGEKEKEGFLSGFRTRTVDVNVMNAETIITNVAIRIMRDGVRGVCVYEGWLQPPLKIL